MRGIEEAVVQQDPEVARKENLRRLARARRKAAHGVFKDQAGMRLAAQGMAALSGLSFASVAGYAPIGTEIDPMPLLTELDLAGKETALPCVQTLGWPLAFRRWRLGDSLQAGLYMEIKEPSLDSELIWPEVILLPLLAFDRLGGRLGYGGGFYDRTVAEYLRAQKPMPILIGVAYASQEFPALPQGAHDLRLNQIITENGVIDCPNSR